ncbi:SDR family NAD(P)-dependent oxidoreductase [Bradyrhizobium iriomotense]|uniref:3-oxoacyl-ACP reductase n=1 Tax=Bradyrhizobium iriomotense TaxID=441950 RepID=A0ABQ6AXX6_9BRAD|nr:SDR family oxidoreductase [Bradyrhizobium iriomotense]GLR86388.1 3-oxoacyl-ACP reductase [Bradyrhizobium iriomotense]
MTAYDSVRYTSLKDRNVLITGGASGIGAEMVKAFAAQGATVSFIDIDVDGGAAIAASTGAEFTACDITDIAALRSAIAAVEGRHGPVAVLINNAARDDRHAMADVEPEAWRRTLALNLDHQFFASQAVRTRMAEAGCGSIVMFGSVSWMRGIPGMAGYTAAKAAINGMTKTLARELGPAGIRVNCIVPGAIVTERQLRLWTTPESNQKFIDSQALKFRLDATHVARMALFLGSDESAGCTGANFVVDAGLT